MVHVVLSVDSVDSVDQNVLLIGASFVFLFFEFDNGWVKSSRARNCDP